MGITKDKEPYHLKRGNMALLVVHPESKERFPDRETMERETKVYDEKRWGTTYDPEAEPCTLKEALEEDAKCADLAKKFPPALRDTCLRLLHFHPADSLQALVEDVFARTRPEEKEDGAASREAEEDKKKAAPRHPIRNRTMLRAFVVEHAEFKTVPGGAVRAWRLRDEREVERLGLPSELGGEALASLLRRREELGSRKRKKAEGERKEKKKEGEGEKKKEKKDGDAPPAKKPKKEGGKEDKEKEGAKTPKKKEEKKDEGAGKTPKKKEEKKEEGAGKTPKKKEEKKDKEEGAGPGKEKKEKAPYTRTVEEEEALVNKNPASLKAVIFRLLKAAGAPGLSVEELHTAITRDRLKDLSGLKDPVASVRSCLTHEDCFCRVRPLVYALTALPGVVPLPAPEKKEKKEGEEGKKRKKEGEDKPKPKKETKEDGEVPPSKKPKKEGEPKAEAKEAEEQPKPKPKLNPLLKMVRGVAAQYEDAPQDVLKGEAEVRRLQGKVRAIRDHLDRLTAESLQAASGGKDHPGSPEKKGGAKESAASIHERAVQECPKFELPADLREEKPDLDRKLKVEWRQRVQEAERAVKKQRDAWIENRKRELQAEKEGKAREAEQRQKAAKQLGEDVKLLERCLAHFEKELGKAEREWEKERKKEEAAAVKAQREREREEEKERRRLEAENAKRYPLEDLELLAELREEAARKGEDPPPQDVPLPGLLDAEAQATEVPLLLISDFLSCFKDSLGLAGRCPTLHQLKEALADDTLGWGLQYEPCERPNPKVLAQLPFRRLTSVYEILLENLLEDAGSSAPGAKDEVSRMERRWLDLLDVEGAWPEIAARYILTDDPEYIPGDVEEAARLLRTRAPETLSLAQHAKLLVHLCDLLMDKDPVRDLISERLEELEQLDKDRFKERNELYAKRRQLKEEEDAKKKAAEEAKRKDEEEGEAAGGDEGAGAGAGGSSPGEDKKKKATGEKAKDKSPEPAPPSMDLPAELQEYKGDPDDRKAMAEFRQRQQAARRALEKELLRWQGEMARREKEARRKREEEERAAYELVRRREELQAEFEALQENYEAARRKIAVRAPFLGEDRRRRRYFWGLGGRKDRVYYQQENAWGALDNIDQVKALLESLDARGVRERALKEALEDNFKAIERALRAAGPGAEEKEGGGRSGRGAGAGAGAPLGIRASGRERKQAQVVYDPNKAHLKSTNEDEEEGGRKRQAKAAVRDAQASADDQERAVRIERLCNREAPRGMFLGETSALEEIAFCHGLLAVLRVAQEGSRLGIELPGSFMDRLESLARGEPPAEALLASPQGNGNGKVDRLRALRKGFKALLEDLERALLKLAGQDPGKLADRARKEEEERMERGEEEDSPPWLKKGVLEYLEEDTDSSHSARRVWFSQQERVTFLYDLERPETFARLGYLAGCLEWVSKPLIKSLKREMAKKGTLKLNEDEELSDSEAEDDEEKENEEEELEGAGKTRGQKKTLKGK